MYSKSRALPLANSEGVFTGTYINDTYSEEEIKRIRKVVRTWPKPIRMSSKYYHVTEKENLENILKVGLLPNEIDGCVFLTKDLTKLSEYAKIYLIDEPVVLEINSLLLKANYFRQSFANNNAKDDVVYLGIIKPHVIKLLEV